ncbi:hypothetical protein BH09PSE4_BH09PSE4_16070 [soil metagenome]
MSGRFSAKRLSIVSAIVSGTLLLSACVEPTAYRPATGAGIYRDGYSEQRIEENRFRVTFSGNAYTGRETVERYLLYRAAELTVQSGYDNFVLVDRNTDKQTRTYVDQPFGPGPFGYWGPSWRYYGRGYGWRGWDPYFGDPFWDRQVDVRTVDRYEASAEIVLGKGPVPAGNVHSFDAHAVLSNLGPSIMAPR